jgi:hypothetical protein
MLASALDFKGFRCQQLENTKLQIPNKSQLPKFVITNLFNSTDLKIQKTASVVSDLFSSIWHLVPDTSYETSFIATAEVGRVSVPADMSRHPSSQMFRRAKRRPTLR